MSDGTGGLRDHYCLGWAIMALAKFDVLVRGTQSQHQQQPRTRSTSKRAGHGNLRTDQAHGRNEAISGRSKTVRLLVH